MRRICFSDYGSYDCLPRLQTRTIRSTNFWTPVRRKRRNRSSSPTKTTYNVFCTYWITLKTSATPSASLKPNRKCTSCTHCWFLPVWNHYALKVLRTALRFKIRSPSRQIDTFTSPFRRLMHPSVVRKYFAHDCRFLTGCGIYNIFYPWKTSSLMKGCEFKFAITRNNSAKAPKCRSWRGWRKRDGS